MHDLPKQYKDYVCRSKPLLQEIVIKCAIWWLLLVVLEMKLFCRAVNVLFENNFNLSHHELKTLFGRIGSVKLSQLGLELWTSSSLCL